MSFIRVYIKNGIRIIYVDALEVASEAIKVHSPKPFASKIVNDVIATFSSLCWLKPIGSLSVQIKGNGAAGNVLLEIKDGEQIRMTMSNFNIEVDKSVNDINTIPIVLGIGDHGIMKIVNEINGHHFGSEVALVRGDLVTDLVYYFNQSEQIFTAITLDTEIDNATNMPIKAKSVVFQLLPSHTEADIQWIEKFIVDKTFKKLNDIDSFEQEIKGKFLEQKEIQWKCRCSDEKMKEAISVLSEAEREEILREIGFIEVSCHFCNRKYKIVNN